MNENNKNIQETIWALLWAIITCLLKEFLKQAVHQYKQGANENITNSQYKQGVDGIEHHKIDSTCCITQNNSETKQFTGSQYKQGA